MPLVPEILNKNTFCFYKHTKSTLNTDLKNNLWPSNMTKNVQHQTDYHTTSEQC